MFYKTHKIISLQNWPVRFSVKGPIFVSILMSGVFPVKESHQRPQLEITQVLKAIVHFYFKKLENVKSIPLLDLCDKIFQVGHEGTLWECRELH